MQSHQLIYRVTSLGVNLKTTSWLPFTRAKNDRQRYKSGFVIKGWKMKSVQTYPLLITKFNITGKWLIPAIQKSMTFSLNGKLRVMRKWKKRKDCQSAILPIHLEWVLKIHLKRALKCIIIFLLRLKTHFKISFKPPVETTPE